MKVTGLITEYNPFHKGHKYHIDKAKEITGADYIIAIMSGDFVQRGTPACVQKHTRAHMALVSGVDLVLELPLSFATGTAEVFAEGAVTILDRLGVVDTICFGSECGDAAPLMEIAKILVNEPDWYRECLQQHLKEGLSFPASRAAALPEFSDILSSPNNILGIEYCKALIRLQSDIQPVAITRKGSMYHEETLSQENHKEVVLPSATAIRTSLSTDVSFDLTNYIPEIAYSIFKEELELHRLMTEDDFSQLLLYQLLLAKSPEDYLIYEDVSEELASRIYKCRMQFQSFSQFADLLKTKELTRTRINRALLHLVLQVQKNGAKAHYARILGFRKDAGPLLSLIKEKAMIPFFSKTAAAKDLMSSKQLQIFEKSLEASMLYEAIAAQKVPTSMIHEHQKPIIII